jgi:hypothetical protein
MSSSPRAFGQGSTRAAQRRVRFGAPSTVYVGDELLGEYREICPMSPSFLHNCCVARHVGANDG